MRIILNCDIAVKPCANEEAVRQVVGRGYAVAEISACLGVSAHRLYKRVKAATPDKIAKQASELLQAKSEILRLRSRMHRVTNPCPIARSRLSAMPGLIRDSYLASGDVFGGLHKAGESCGKHRIAKIMRRHQIKALRGYKAPRHIAGHPIVLQ